MESPRFNTMLMALSVACMMKGEIPSAIIFFRMEKSMARFFLRMRMADFSERRNFTTHTALTAWEIIVARAAPCTFIFNTKMKMGSRMMLITAPISTESMAVRACPWEEINMFSPRANCTKIVPMR